MFGVRVGPHTKSCFGKVAECPGFFLQVDFWLVLSVLELILYFWPLVLFYRPHNTEGLVVYDV